MSPCVSSKSMSKLSFKFSVNILTLFLMFPCIWCQGAGLLYTFSDSLYRSLVPNSCCCMGLMWIILNFSSIDWILVPQELWLRILISLISSPSVVVAVVAVAIAVVVATTIIIILLIFFHFKSNKILPNTNRQYYLLRLRRKGTLKFITFVVHKTLFLNT